MRLRLAQLKIGSAAGLLRSRRTALRSRRTALPGACRGASGVACSCLVECIPVGPAVEDGQLAVAGGMLVRRIWLAKVMSEANDYDNSPVQGGRGAGDVLANLGRAASAPDAGRASRARSATRTLRHPARRSRRAGEAHGDDAGRASRAREGAAALDHQGHRVFGRTRPHPADAASNRPPAGGSHRDRSRQGRGAEGASAARGVAGAPAAGSQPGRARGAEGGAADPGEAQPDVTGHSGPGAPADPAQAPAAKQRRRTFSSLRVRNFRLFATGQVISNTGTWMQRVAQDWLVLELTHGSGTAIGIATGLQFLPLLLFSLWGGMIADRYPKRRVLMVTQATMGALAVILGVLAVTGAVRTWQVYLLAFGLGMATVVDNPTRQSFAVEMVGKADLTNAIALNSAVFNLARIVGPAVAGLVISL